MTKKAPVRTPATASTARWEIDSRTRETFSDKVP
jgi:hypothetical protein